MHVLLSVGNAPGLHTGYGGQALLMLKAILEAHPDNRATVLCWNFQVRGPSAMRPVPTSTFVQVAPSMAGVLARLTAAEQDAWRTRVTWMGNWYPTFPAPIQKTHLNTAILNAGADLFVCLQDIFMFQPGAFACPSVVWMPLHFLPVEKSTVRALSDFDVLVGISGHGASLLSELFGAHHGVRAMKHVEWIPHGRDARVFAPAPHQLDASDKGVALHRAHKAELRRSLGWPTHVPTSALECSAWDDVAPGGQGAVHITLLVASNSEESGRKAYDAQLQAWIAFADARERRGFPRQATFLVIHAEAARAYDLGRLLETFGEFPARGAYEDMKDRRGRTMVDATTEIRGERFLIVAGNQLGNTSDARMATMFQAADVLLAASTSEGCGVPILEAQLCGCPVVTNHTTAMPEQTVLGVSAPAGQYIARMDFNAGWFLPDVKEVAAALHTTSLWTDRERAERAAAALPIVCERYDQTPVVRAWVNLLQRVQRDVITPWYKHAAASGGKLEEARGDNVGDKTRASATVQEEEKEEPWRVDFAAWLRAPPLRIGLPEERHAALLAARVANERTRDLTFGQESVANLRRARAALWERLTYVDGAIYEMKQARGALRAQTDVHVS